MNNDEKRVWNEYFIGTTKTTVCGSIIYWRGEYYNDSPIWYIKTNNHIKSLVRCVDGNWYKTSNCEYSYTIPQKPSSYLFPRSIIQHSVFDELEYLTKFFDIKSKYNNIIIFLMEVLLLPEEMICHILSFLRNIEIESLKIIL